MVRVENLCVITSIVCWPPAYLHPISHRTVGGRSYWVRLLWSLLANALTRGRGTLQPNGLPVLDPLQSFRSELRPMAFLVEAWLCGLVHHRPGRLLYGGVRRNHRPIRFNRPSADLVVRGYYPHLPGDPVAVHVCIGAWPYQDAFALATPSPSMMVMYLSIGRPVNRSVVPLGSGHFTSSQSILVRAPRPSTRRGSCDDK